jgi:nucleotide-binding universal stress UspA family protein
MERKKILVPVDFKELSFAALDYAKEIALEIKSKIACLYVIEEFGYITGNFLTKEIQENIRREAESQLAKVANSFLGNDEIPYEIIISRGKVHQKITNVAKQVKADIIILGRSNNRENKLVEIGTNTHHLIRDSKTPVITINKQKKFFKYDILLPLNLAEPFKGKIEKAINLASTLHVGLSILSVIPIKEGEKYNMYHQLLDKIKLIIERQKVKCKTFLIKSTQPISKVISNFVAENEIEMIVVMTQHEINFLDYFISSTAQQIINQAKIPTLSIIPQSDFGPELEEDFLYLLDPLVYD